MWKESVKLVFSKTPAIIEVQQQHPIVSQVVCLHNICKVDGSLTDKSFMVDANGFGGTHQANYSLWVQESKKTSVLSALGAGSMGKGKACYDIQHISILDRSERT